MREIICDVAVIGAGPAGLAAAAAAKKAGAKRVLVLERDTAPGGILQQCIHAGFGLHYFKKEMTGPEYAHAFIQRAKDAGVEFLFATMVLELSATRLLCVGAGAGMLSVRAGAVVLAMGCRERTRGALHIPGARPAGVFTAGTAQRLLNMQNGVVGSRVVILGSGDIGMIMARRFTLEGAKVEAVAELMPYLAGLARNKAQCLDDFGIPLLLSHTVVDILGSARVEAVRVAPVDADLVPIMEKSRVIACDTLLLSVGLIPENELSAGAGIALDAITRGPVVDQFLQTGLPGVFACGNVLHVNDLADNVSRESKAAGMWAARYAAGLLPPAGCSHAATPGENVRYVCPQRICTGGEEARLFFRVAAPMRDVEMRAECGGRLLASRRAAKAGPGEMESLLISGETVAALSGPVIVRCVPATA